LPTGPFRYCPYCRADLQTRRIPASEGPERRVCAVCGFIEWGNSKPTAAGIVEDEAGRVLLGRRTIAPFHGWWDVPGGFLEAGEHPEAGVRRELREETGLAVRVERLLGVYMGTYGEDGAGEHLLNFYYICRVENGVLRPDDDLGELAWFAPDAIPERVAFASSRRALADWRRGKESDRR
jgi:ADP-ribose pyrophosphatase YjhB (NUDIX family)